MNLQERETALWQANYRRANVSLWRHDKGRTDLPDYKKIDQAENRVTRVIDGILLPWADEDKGDDAC